MIQVTSTSEEKVPVVLEPLTANGNPAEVENTVVTVVSGDATIETVDNKNFFVVSGAGGLSVIEVKADADLGEGVVELVDTVEYFVTAAQATALGMTSGTPVVK